MLKKLEGLMKLGLPKPLYYDALHSNPPLAFPQSSQKPPKISFPEDRLRARFYRDHPLELDTPLQVTNPTTATASTVDAEWAIQRQLQLMSGTEPLSVEEAYTRACDELKRKRVEGEIGRRLAGRTAGVTAGNELLEEILLEERRVLELERSNPTVKIQKRK